MLLALTELEVNRGALWLLMGICVAPATVWMVRRRIAQARSGALDRRRTIENVIDGFVMGIGVGLGVAVLILFVEAVIARATT